MRLRGNFAVCLVLALAMPVLPALAQAPEPEDRSAEERTELDDVTLSFRFRSGEEFEVDQLLQQWGVALGQIVIADSQIRGQKIKLLTQSATMTWKVFKKILMMNGVVVVEEKVGADQLLIKAYMQRNLQTNESPPFSFEGVGRRLPRRSEIVTAAIQVKNGAGREIFATVRGLLTRDRNRVGEILHVPGPEVILVTDFAPNVEYYKNIIQALDIQAPGQKIRIRKLEYAIPSELSQVLSQLFTTDDSLGRPIGFQVAVGAQVEQTASSARGSSPSSRTISSGPRTDGSGSFRPRRSLSPTCTAARSSRRRRCPSTTRPGRPAGDERPARPGVTPAE